MGHETLSERELQTLLTAQESLVFIKGQWVDVDKEKPAGALAHWKNVEAKANQDGLSFVEGMRLLVGASADLSRSDTQRRSTMGLCPTGDLAGIAT